MALGSLAMSVHVVDSSTTGIWRCRALCAICANGTAKTLAYHNSGSNPVFRVHFVKVAGKAPKENNGYFVCGIQILEHLLHDMASYGSSHSVIIGKVRASNALFSPTFILSIGPAQVLGINFELFSWTQTAPCLVQSRTHTWI
jgi:hypothetical protein